MKNNTTVSVSKGEVLKKLTLEYNVTTLYLCNCGAFTFEFEDGKDYSVKVSNAHKFFPSISEEEFKTLAESMETHYVYCNHCARGKKRKKVC